MKVHSSVDMKVHSSVYMKVHSSVYMKVHCFVDMKVHSCTVYPYDSETNCIRLFDDFLCII